MRGYRAGDLDREFAGLDVEEDYLYAYGFVARRIWRLLHPRGSRKLSALERKVLDAVRDLGAVHPRQLEARFGSKRVTNAWGGMSKATTSALDHLHHRGLLQVARREVGIRVYRAAPAGDEPLAARDRMRGLVLAVADALAPVPERTLHGIAARLRRWIPDAPDHRVIVRELRTSGEMEAQAVGGVVHLWPAASPAVDEPPRRVRFLAPFDPVVWDRGRFEQLFGWSYRFEAYTPAARRVRGYYAMPLLWIDRVVGWANASAAEGALRVELGFAGARPRERDFRREADAEIARLEAFLMPA